MFFSLPRLSPLSFHHPFTQARQVVAGPLPYHVSRALVFQTLTIYPRNQLSTLFSLFGLLFSSPLSYLQGFGCCTFRRSSGDWNLELGPLFRPPG